MKHFENLLRYLDIKCGQVAEKWPISWNQKEIFTQERFLGSPPKEVVQLGMGTDVRIAKCIICCETLTFCGIKSQETFLPMCSSLSMHIDNAMVLLSR